MLSVRTLVNSRLSQRLRKDEDAPYSVKTLNMTSTRNGTPAKFPTLNVDSLGEPSTADDLEHKKLFFDSKTILQEIVQGEHEQLTYILTDESGPDHNKSFTVEVCVGEKILGTGSGHTKKAAEQEAAYQALLTIKAEKGSRECI